MRCVRDAVRGAIRFERGVACVASSRNPRRRGRGARVVRDQTEGKSARVPDEKGLSSTFSSKQSICVDATATVCSGEQKKTDTKFDVVV